tara:strand:- start:743 stop:862 length:120 start_codon:yes stop_codon:yes gene_type:complete
MIDDRGKANSSFEGENHFKFKKTRNFPNNNQGRSMMEES